ncbi:MAG TPA: energy transducer TonB [Terracidiphilus sp.]|jgi:protein TonB|nr:energy transducer TonB [Terracidiphilus sp.]
MLLSVSTAERTNPWAFGTATLINGALLALVLSMGLRTMVPRTPLQLQHHTPIAIQDLPLFAIPSTGGSGGGANEATDPIQGHLPKIERIPLTPPQVPVLENPKLAIDPAIAAPQDIKLPDNPNMPTIGVYRSPNVTMLSNGPGSHAGIGTGDRDGLGPGGGPRGYGPGDSDGVYIPGNGVSAPIPVFTPEAEFSDEARREKYQGVCMISVIIDAHGNPQNPRVIRSLGMGLDEKALEAVNRYRFKPAMKQGHPVAARIVVAVNFRLF